ncbi:hypothetical protein [Streptomyces sp. NPDC055749]
MPATPFNGLKADIAPGAAVPLDLNSGLRAASSSAPAPGPAASTSAAPDLA